MEFKREKTLFTGKSVGELLQEATGLLKHVSNEGRHEVEILLSHYLGKERWYLYSHREEEVPPEVEKNFWRAVKLREKYCPLAYITGIKEFYGLEFYVDNRVLIPRPETELLVEVVESWLQEYGKPGCSFLQAADLGTGCGALAVTMARLFPGMQLWATDIDKGALKVAAKNINLHRIEHRVCLCRGDYWEAVKNVETGFDIVVSNPPYLTSTEMEQLTPEIKYYEPVRALWGGKDGLEAYRTIVEKLPEYLNSPGIAVLEISPTTAGGACNLVQERAGDASLCLQTVLDYSGRERLLKITR